MKKFGQIAITWAAFIAMFAMNAAANFIPVNGYNTGQVADLYPNLFVPDGLTFSIWSLIYLWLLVFLGYATNILVWLPGVDHRYRRIVSILPLFWLSCLLNAAWILSWHFLQIGLSVAIMLALLASLLAIFLKIRNMQAHPRKKDHFLVEIPFIIYFGWISVATIANITALLVHTGWNGWGLSPETWAVMMIFTAVLLAAFMSYFHHRPTYSLVVAWALWGIFRKQSGEETGIATFALFGMLICFAVSLPELLKPQKGWKQNF